MSRDQSKGTPSQLNWLIALSSTIAFICSTFYLASLLRFFPLTSLLFHFKWIFILLIATPFILMILASGDPYRGNGLPLRNLYRKAPGYYRFPARFMFGIVLATLVYGKVLTFDEHLMTPQMNSCVIIMWYSVLSLLAWILTLTHLFVLKASLHSFSSSSSA